MNLLLGLTHYSTKTVIKRLLFKKEMKNDTDDTEWYLNAWMILNNEWTLKNNNIA